MVEVSLRDEKGKEVPHDGKSLGEVWVRSPWLPEGYYKEPEKTKASYIDGWFRTGDLGTFYPNGLLYVADREGDAVKSGGEWIPTGTLEAILSEHPSVAIVAVVPMKDDRWGQRPLAVIKAAKEVSEGPSAKKGGDLGFFKRGQMVKPFEEAAFAMKPGQTSGIVRTRLGFHIIKVTDKKPESMTDFKKVEEKIKTYLKQKKVQEGVQTLIASLRKKAKIEKMMGAGK
jgi:acyl-CoA synthetase (AMP-forming)/AMP-acid ligase II